MKIYNFHPVTKEYISEGLADADPLQVGNWLIPANATTVQPAPAGNNEVAVFKDREWVVEADHRGEVWYDSNGDEIKIDAIGVKPDENWTLVKPITPPTLAERKAEKQREIDTLEATLFMTRGEREAWLIQLETIATQQSVSLDVLYQANPFYKKLKDCDVAVTALRAELKAMV